jgi:hypothetical protein
MGEVIAIDPRCTLDGTTLSCSLGKVRKFRSATVWFDAAFAHTDAPLTISANASSNVRDPSMGNNEANADVLLSYPVSPIVDGDDAVVEHCTGSGLTSFFECVLSPSSISSHAIEFHGNGTLDFTNPSGTSFHGTWSQSPDDSHLTMHYFDGLVPQATFVGRAVNASCFEGITTFPNSGNNSAYSICL